MNKPNINLKYREQDGMMLPDLQISNSSEADQPLGRYGRMALEYLRENHPERFTTLKMDRLLLEHLLGQGFDLLGRLVLYPVHDLHQTAIHFQSRKS